MALDRRAQAVLAGGPGRPNRREDAAAPSMELLRRYRKHYPVEKFVSHRYSIEEAETALRHSMADDSMKVVIASPEFRR